MGLIGPEGRWHWLPRAHFAVEREPVWSRNSCGLPLVELEQPAEALAVQILPAVSPTRSGGVGNKIAFPFPWWFLSVWKCCVYFESTCRKELPHSKGIAFALAQRFGRLDPRSLRHHWSNLGSVRCQTSRSASAVGYHNQPP